MDAAEHGRGHASAENASCAGFGNPKAAGRVPGTSPEPGMQPCNGIAMGAIRSPARAIARRDALPVQDTHAPGPAGFGRRSSNLG